MCVIALSSGAQAFLDDDEDNQEQEGIIPDTRTNAAFIGIKAGGNYSLMGEYKPVDLEQKGGIGFEGGAVFGVRFGKYTKSSPAGTGRIALQLEPTYAQYTSKVADKDLKLGYFSMPLLFKYFITPNFNVELGPAFCLALSSSPDEIQNGAVRIATGNLKGNDVKLCIGLNYETNGGFFIGARYNHGMSDLAGNFACKLSVACVTLGYKFNIFKF